MARQPTTSVRWRGTALFLLIAAGLLGGATLLDALVYDLAGRLDIPTSSGRHFLLWITGYAPTWVAAAAVLMLIDARRWRHGGPKAVLRRGSFLMVTVVIAGLLSEAAKVLIRRLRPTLTDGEYVFRAWSNRPLSTANLAMPSGDATVAFAGAYALCLLFPRAAPLWLLAAIVCAAERVVLRAHFLSDVIAGALLAFVVTWVLWRLGRRLSEPVDPREHRLPAPRVGGPLASRADPPPDE